MTQNVIIDLHLGNFDMHCGGVMVQFELCKILCELGLNARIKSHSHIENNVCNNYYNNEFPIDENVVVIYGETIPGNPSNARKVVRWILAPLGFFFDYDTINTWGKNDLVYYFNSEEKFEKEPERVNRIYKLLTSIFMNPCIKRTNFEPRTGICHTIRKANQTHKSGFNMVHPPDSFHLTHNHTQLEYIEFFNKFKFFICYDALTFYIVIAALCGCIPIVYKIDGLTKQEWIQTTAAAEYCKSKGVFNLYGIAYGEEDLEYADSTIHLVKEQWDDIIKFNKEKTIVSFINDIQNFDDQRMLNSVGENFY
jgi:hypothetical protein